MLASNLLSVSDSTTCLSSLLSKQSLKGKPITIGTATGTQGILVIGNSRVIQYHLRDSSTKASYVLSFPIGPAVGNQLWVGQVFSNVNMAQPTSSSATNTLNHYGFTVWKATGSTITQNGLSTISGFSDIPGAPSPPYVLPITSSGTPGSLTAPAMINFTATFTPSANPLIIEAQFVIDEIINSVN
jgi:hypothetical protein